MPSPSLALCTKVFSRTNALARLLRTLPDCFDGVYVADDGPKDNDRDALYEQFADTVEVIDLPYDAGVSAGRNAAVNAASEEYVCLVDSDHCVPPTVTTLVDQLEVDRSLGGLGGALARPQDDVLRYVGVDFAERDGGKTFTMSPFLYDKSIEILAGSPIVRFDFLANAGVFRREVLAEYPWDEQYINSNEHKDFYVTHWKHSPWEFALSPSVYFEHHPGGDSEYVAERHNDAKKRDSTAYFLNKWGYTETVIRQWEWTSISGLQSEHLSIAENALRVIREDGVADLVRRGVDYSIRRYRDSRPRNLADFEDE